MFSNIRRLIGAIKVVEVHDEIRIEGLPARVTMKDIYTIWSTSKIGQHMFTHVGRSEVVFNKFFAPDIVYAFKMIIETREGRPHVRALKRVVELMYEHTWLKNTIGPQKSILNYDKLRNLTVTLLPHQKDFLSAYDYNVPRYNLKGYLLAAVPGSGKTIAGLALAEVLEADVVVCIVPKNAVNTVWENTIVSMYKVPPKYWVSTTPGDPPPDCRHYVFHYDRLDEAVEFFHKHKFKKPVVLLDESHNLNEIDSLRTQLFIELCTQALYARHVIWASGTPVKAIGNEVIPLLLTLDDYFDADAQVRFKNIYGKNSQRAVDILRNRLGMMTFKVKKEVVVGNDVVEKNITVKMPHGDKYTLDAVREEMRKFISQQMAYYEKNMAGFVTFYFECMEQHSRHLHGSAIAEFEKYQHYVEIIRQGYDPATMKEMVVFCNNYELKKIVPTLPSTMRDEFKGARSVVKYYHLKVQGEALGRILGRLRAQCHVDMVPHVDWSDIIDTALKKTLIFTSYVEVVDALDAYLTKEGYSPLKVYGETNKDLTSIVDRYKNDVDANPLNATYKSLSTAVPLVMANTVVLFNSPFREYERDQAVSRADRLGQDSQVVIYNILLDTDGKPNISTRSNDILEWSKQQVEAIMGTQADLTDVSMEAYRDLLGIDLPPEQPEVVENKPGWVSW